MYLFSPDHPPVLSLFYLNYEAAKSIFNEEYLKKQDRFSHMFKKGNEWMIETYQAEIDRKWDDLLFNCSRA
ncbi:MAG: hypothetical protein VB106_19815 [Clostridiaceae bacterium]|nr:hypothetical protein [Clostridiaceae bacterium]